MFQFAAAQRSRHSRRSKHRKARPKRAVVGKTGANSGKSTIFGGPIAPSAVIVAPEEIDTIESVLPCSIIPGQSIALKTIGRISNFRPPIIVDLPEMKGLLATSTAFLHAECYAQRAVLLNKPTDAVSFGGASLPLFRRNLLFY